MQGRTQLVRAQDVTSTTEIADHYPNVNAGKLIHTAVMQRVGADRIISADTTSTGRKALSGFKDYLILTTYLNHATRSVLQIGETAPQSEES